uniref:EF-hand domain-containing protein n=1 Tax=Alexandrium catenella TaxID=2925 RepID=A0A7S1L1E5_ALECA|mmetsp:Transcript_104317/g.277540  ORF Transcript_104317/g.277540 Transcript_104317/m.277540 type:complete len:668 (+) Transcript_104317:31-2034(+)
MVLHPDPPQPSYRERAWARQVKRPSPPCSEDSSTESVGSRQVQVTEEAGEAAGTTLARSGQVAVAAPDLKTPSRRGTLGEAADQGSLCLEIFARLEQHHGDLVQRMDKHYGDLAQRMTELIAQQDAIEQSVVQLKCSSDFCEDYRSPPTLRSMSVDSELLEPPPQDTGPEREGAGAGQCSDEWLAEGGEAVRQVSSDGHSADSEDQRRRESAFALGSLDSNASLARAAEASCAARCRSWLRDFLKTGHVEVALATAVLVNSLLVGAEIEFKARTPKSIPGALDYLDTFFTLLFLCELVLRWWVEGFQRFFTGSDWAWNTFDFFIVLASGVDLAIKVVASLDSVDNMNNLRILRVFRIMRVGKALRIQRLVRFISALRTLVYCIVVTMRSLVWALILLLIIIYIFAIIISQISVDYIQEPGSQPHPGLERWWGTLGTAMLTLFEAVTGGVSWYEVTDPLQEVSAALVAVFITYVFIITFAVFNCITGIFCHSAIETAVRNPDLAAQAMVEDRRQYISRVKKLFRDVDADRSGAITVQELETVVKDEKVRAYFAALDLDLSDSWTLFKLIAGRNNLIDQDAFVKGCLRLRGYAQRLETVAMLAQTRVLLRRLSSFAKFTTRKLEGMSPKAAALPQRRSIWSTSALDQSCTPWAPRAGCRGCAPPRQQEV